MPSPDAGADPPADRLARPWVRAGLALLAVWSGLLALAVGLWLDLAFLPAEDEGVHGYLAVLGAPFVLVAVGLLWWAWRSARALLAGRRDGWTRLLVVGGVAVAQAVMTARVSSRRPRGRAPRVRAMPVARRARCSQGSWPPSAWDWPRWSSPCWAVVPGHPSMQGTTPTPSEHHRRRPDAAEPSERATRCPGWLTVTPPGRPASGAENPSQVRWGSIGWPEEPGRGWHGPPRGQARPARRGAGAG
ncbi:hypothetical protein GCM10023168_08830 [Fodinibacter luteus]|uniref:Integral membrane protein n=1 Tax=Fodinibacter luteus TaxID=552064 RepID=A0ABP8K460_9MICO